MGKVSIVFVILMVSTFFGLCGWLIYAANATTYYVDATGGDDTNNGTTVDTAWRSLEKVNNAELNPGDTVLFKRGECWREQLIPRSGDGIDGVITYSDYGDGNLDKPLFLGSTQRNNIFDWIDLGNNIWQTATIFDVVEPNGSELLPNPSFDVNTTGWNFSRSLPAIATGERTTEENEYDTDPAGYKISCSQQGSNQNNIQFYTNSRISIDANQYYLLSFRAKCDGVESINIGEIVLMQQSSPWAKYGSNYKGQKPKITQEWDTYKMLCKSTVNANDGRITFYIGNSLPAGSILYIDTLSFRKCDNVPEYLIPDLKDDIGNIIFNDETCGYKVWSIGELSVDKSGSTPKWIPVEKQGRFWYDETNKKVRMYSVGNPASYYDSIELAKKRHIIETTNKNYITFENLNLRYGAAHGLFFMNVQHVEIRNCDISFIGGGFGHWYNNVPIRYGNAIEFWRNAQDCLVENCKIWEIFDAGLTNQNSDTAIQTNLRYRNNIVWNCEYSYEFFLAGDSTASNIFVENNTFVNAGYGWGHWQRTDYQNGRHLQLSRNLGDTDSFYIRNNILYEATESCMRVVQPNTSISNIILDNNLYYMSSGNVINWGGNEYNLDGFRAAVSGKEINSIEADPQFVDVSIRDFHLQSTSPAIDAGIDVACPLDFDNNNRHIGSQYDIGAFEYQMINISVSVQDDIWTINCTANADSEVIVLMQNNDRELLYIDQKTSDVNGICIFTAFLPTDVPRTIKVGCSGIERPICVNLK